MADIFISYSRSDRSQIEKLANALDAWGYSVWWDCHLAGGSEFSDDIEHELEAARVVLVAWSKESSKSRWVRDEAGTAIEAGKMVAVSLDGAQPPLGFRQLHTIDLHGEPKRTLAELESSLARKLKGEPAPARAVNRPVPIGKQTTYALLAALFVVALAFIAWRLTADKEDEGTKAVAATTIDRGKSIAVAPLRSLAASGDNDWFAPALTSEITNSLGRVPDLVVASESSVLALRGKSAKQIASELQVAHVLEGSVLRTDNRLKVNIALVAADGRQIWSETYDRKPDDLISVQEDIASGVAKAMGTLLDPAELDKFINTGTKSFEAYELYLQAVQEWNGEQSDLPKFFAQVERAYQVDPNFAAAHILAAAVHLETLSIFYGSPSRPRDIAAEWRAFERELGAASVVAKRDVDLMKLKYLRAFSSGNLRAAQSAAQEIVTKHPGLGNNYWQLLHFNVMLGDTANNKALIDRFRKVSPEDLGSAIHLYRESGLINQALPLAVAELRTPSSADALSEAAVVFIQAKRLRDARNAVEKYDNSFGPSHTAAYIRAFIACAEGDRQAMLRAADEAPRIGIQYAFLLAAGERAKARDLLIKDDRATPPYPLLQGAYAGVIDVRDFPNLTALFAREGIDPPGLLLPARCTG